MMTWQWAMSSTEIGREQTVFRSYWQKISQGTSLGRDGQGRHGGACDEEHSQW